jgi:ATP-dependent protease ClpP protease subunit
MRKAEDDELFSLLKPQVAVYRDKNTVFFYDELNPESIYTLEKHMRDIYESSRVDHIDLVIDSGGGSPCAVYDFLKAFPIPVHGYVKGYCCSGATTILLGCSKRYMAPSSLLLIHSYQGPGDDWEREGSIRDNYNNIMRMNATLKSIYHKETRIPIKQLDALLSDRERYLTASECMKWKIIHGIASYVGV